MAEDNQIDELLARYLELLDTYTSLRASLSELQSSIYQSLARANFSAERGVRYGQDFYDERMQATKSLIADKDKDGIPMFDLDDLNAQPPVGPTATVDEKPAQPKEEEKDEIQSDEKTSDDSKFDEAPRAETNKQAKRRDPLRWFGILAPPPLRQAQTSASRLVHTAVNLASIDGEMKTVEIEIRRARKRKVTGEKAAMGLKEEDGETLDGEIDKVKKEDREGESVAKINRGGGCGRVAI